MSKLQLLYPRSLWARGGERLIIQESDHCVKYNSRLVLVPWETRGCMDGLRWARHSEWKECYVERNRGRKGHGECGVRTRVSCVLQWEAIYSFVEHSQENPQPRWERASSVGIFWVIRAPVLGETVPGRVPACLAGLTCVSLPSPGLSKTYRSHGPAPLHRNCPSSAASCLDHRHHVCTKEAEEKENLLYLPTENQYVRTNKPRVLWQSMN